MLLQSFIKQVVQSQQERLFQKELGYERVCLSSLPDITSHALIISGIRRCGKSTLLLQLMKSKFSNALYINFEDPRLYGFDANDFLKLNEIVQDINPSVLLFDEIQIVKGWENYVRFTLDQGYRTIVTGSNATMLSLELGSKLTGRHITFELFPFSYQEFLGFSKLAASSSSLSEFLRFGGFPEYQKIRIDEILEQVFTDIIIRDITQRFGIRNINVIKELAVWLISNVAKPVTGNSLKKLFSVGAVSSVMEYLSFFENSYLFYFVPKFSYSIKNQLINPRKIYAVDTGLVNVNSRSFTDDYGRLLENLVFLQLRRNFKEIYYFSNRGECDFIVFSKGKIFTVIQVCYSLNMDNMDREIAGLVEALLYFNLKNGLLITFETKDELVKDDKIISIKPFYLWALEE
jgi:predicted AAA+ superfamily ATPase